jgi:putative peptidoglycan lipid II flippase
MNRGLELALFFTVPAAVALIVIPLPIITVLFERGAFDRTSSEATASALAAFALGLPAYVLVKIQQPGFFAREDTVTPLRFAAISVGANIALSLALFWHLGHVGLALATALAAWLNAALLGITLKRRGFLTIDPRLRRRLPRIAAASLIMGAALWAGWVALTGWFQGGLSAQVATLVLLVGGGLVVYGALAIAFRAVSIEDIKTLRSRGT